MIRGRALKRTVKEAGSLGYCWINLIFITFDNPAACPPLLGSETTAKETSPNLKVTAQTG